MAGLPERQRFAKEKKRHFFEILFFPVDKIPFGGI